MRAATCTRSGSCCTSCWREPPSATRGEKERAAAARRRDSNGPAHDRSEGAGSRARGSLSDDARSGGGPAPARAPVGRGAARMVRDRQRHERGHRTYDAAAALRAAPALVLRRGSRAARSAGVRDTRNLLRQPLGELRCRPTVRQRKRCRRGCPDQRGSRRRLARSAHGRVGPERSGTRVVDQLS